MATTLNHKTIDTGISAHLGFYSDAIEVNQPTRWLFTSGTPGISEDGNLPTDITTQATVAWQNIIAALKKANMELSDIVKVTQSLTRVEDVATYVKVRKSILGELKPAFMLSVVTMLIRPEVLVEVEVIAAK